MPKLEETKEDEEKKEEEEEDCSDELTECPSTHFLPGFGYEDDDKPFIEINQEAYNTEVFKEEPKEPKIIFKLGGENLRFQLKDHLQKQKKHPEKYKELKVTIYDLSDDTLDAYKELYQNFPKTSFENLHFHFGSHFYKEHIQKLQGILEKTEEDDY